jgi:signal transduction histidine kinase
MRTATIDTEALRRNWGVERLLGPSQDPYELTVRNLFEPTCNIAGIVSGFTGDGTKTVIPSEAMVKIDFRLVPEQDPRRIREVVVNLVANAIDATPPGGDVVVEVRRAGDAIEIAVRDTGHGMPQEMLRRLGTPFFTTRDDGTGLGIVLARSVVAQHGGSLRYDSEPGKGTTASITLPARHAASRCHDGTRTARR